MENLYKLLMYIHVSFKVMNFAPRSTQFVAIFLCFVFYKFNRIRFLFDELAIVTNDYICYIFIP